MNLNQIFDQLWQRYAAINPQAQSIHHLLQHEGETLINDHVAFRTFNHPKLGIEHLAQPFLQLGYRACGEYHFKEKKLFARHYEHQDPRWPKIFISELLCQQLSSKSQSMIEGWIRSFTDEIFNSNLLCLAGRPWLPRHEEYRQVLAESEYAAWLYAWGYCANHFTVNVNALKKYTTIAQINTLLKTCGYKLNSSGGEIKGEESDFLQQSSTLAAVVPCTFQEGTYAIPSCYYEFARRFPMPNGRIYQGFVEKSADRIFESTASHSPQQP